MDYSPIFMLDRNEPFEIKAIGVTKFTSTSRSDSFPKRLIELKENIKEVYEFAVWFDYDIQHLYELEHVWVYVGNDDSVIKVEGSFHGKYLNVVDLDTNKPRLEGTHPIVYMQPGKHAILSDKRLVYLVPDWSESCNEKAGAAGVDVHEYIADKVIVDEALQEKTKRYIKEVYSFTPSMEFDPFIPEEKLYMSWEELKISIPERMNSELEKIKAYT